MKTANFEAARALAARMTVRILMGSALMMAWAAFELHCHCALGRMQQKAETCERKEGIDSCIGPTSILTIVY
jgi:hypothetical protein